MELILQNQLPHQQKAVDAICGALDGVHILGPRSYFQNPAIDLRDPVLEQNIHRQQKNLVPELRGGGVGSYLNLDIKMETGTGKTYVYTKTMFELHQKFGLNKFILVVPTLSIKAGARQFLEDEYVRRHFSDACGYHCEIELEVLEPAKKKKRKDKYPDAVTQFVKGSHQSRNKIYVLLVNMQMLTGSKMLTRQNYDSGVEGFYRPMDALAATLPVLLMDEPHRFGKGQKAFQVLTTELKPQCMIRFGATFPELAVGRGKDRTVKKDYQNLLYDLNACEAFAQNLIKGVAKEHFEPASKREEKLKITAVHSRDSAVFQLKQRGRETRSFTLKAGDSLGVVSKALSGVMVAGVGTSAVAFSNGLTKLEGEELDVDVYMTSYQEEMMRLALQRHFETERANFSGRNYKIKTLALFFIDDIASYRPSPDRKAPYLKLAFERLLRERIELVLSDLTKQEAEYRAYLKASLEDIGACHAGYFAQDNSDADEEIAQEVDDILRNKKQLLSFRGPDGTHNTRRFLFSKWTLKEGWDNPNVFTIVKLRSSGSDISRIQEVGRGLRLPVDENGNRIATEAFTLNYIVDFTEADFAQKLADEINAELFRPDEIKEEQLERMAQKLKITQEELFDRLYSKRYIDFHWNIRPEHREAFFEEYPEFFGGLPAGKIIDRNLTQYRPVKIRPQVFEKLEAFWQQLSRKYLLVYDEALDQELPDALLQILEEGVFSDVVLSSRRETLYSNGREMSVSAMSGVQYQIDRTMPYREFLQRAGQATNIPAPVLHRAIAAYAKRNSFDKRQINEASLAMFCTRFQEWKMRYLVGRFRYLPCHTAPGSTALSFADGAARAEIAQGRVGTKVAQGTPSDQYLYDTVAYDAPLERSNIDTALENVVAYGKIPRNSVAIPTITGGAYSPDFMYLIKREDGHTLQLVVETKDVGLEGDLRGVEGLKIRCAEAFFGQMQKDGYPIYFCTQKSQREMRRVIEDLQRSLAPSYKGVEE